MGTLLWLPGGRVGLCVCECVMGNDRAMLSLWEV